MELTELYEIQGGLKANIDYKGKDKFERMMLAMMVEFMECANDWQQFKYWKKNNQPKETLLEEYVDGLHFILEAGLDLVERGEIEAVPDEMRAETIQDDWTITQQFKVILRTALELDDCYLGMKIGNYISLFEEYLALGQMLGFSEKEIYKAYLDKNRENHERQNTGY